MKVIDSVAVTDHLHIRIRFHDGVEDDLDVSREPRTGVFKSWDDPDFFAQVKIGERGRSLVWPGELDLCADSLWLELTGQPPESIYPGLSSVPEHA